MLVLVLAPAIAYPASGEDVLALATRMVDEIGPRLKHLLGRVRRPDVF